MSSNNSPILIPNKRKDECNNNVIPTFDISKITRLTPTKNSPIINMPQLTLVRQYAYYIPVNKHREAY